MKTIITFLTVLASFLTSNLATKEPNVYGFTSYINLNPLTISANTGEKPQAKVWTYNNKHWSVLANSTGTYLWRLDGTTWTNVLSLSTRTTSKSDCRVVGNVTHIFLYQGTSSQFVSIEYDAATSKYKLWSRRNTIVGLTLEAGVETASIDIDGTGRMWLANAGTTGVHVRYSDAPYSTWSAPITIATGINDDDICAVVVLPGKIGVFWSNQTTKRFGFKTHTDGTLPSTWSTDEIPASQSALNIGRGMADDHLNLMAASDGTLYCAVKTNYDKTGYPQVALLVRRPGGTWDNLYDVSQAGSRPIIVLNEVTAKIRVVYTSAGSGMGNIVYKESPTSAISFGAQLTLMSGSYNDVTTSHQTFTSEVVILASNNSQAAGVLASDGQPTPTAPTVQSILRQLPLASSTNATSVTFRVTFSEAVTGVDAGDFTATVVSGTLTATVSGASAVGTAGTTYDITVNPVNGNGTLRLDLKSTGTGISDLDGTGISTGYTSGQTYTIDQARPTVTSINRQSPTTESTTATSVTFRTTFSEAVTGVDAADFATTVVSGSLSSTISGITTVSSSIYDITVSSINGTGVLRLDLKATGTGIADLVNNGISGSFTGGQTYSISASDATAPTVQSILRQSPTTASTNASSVTYQITFSEAVTGVDATDFTRTIVSGSLTAAISGITTVSSSVYRVTVGSISGNGVLRLDLNASGTGITDGTGNAISTGYTSGETYTIDQTAPTVLSINRQSPTTQSTSATSVTFRVTFSEAVTGVDVTDFTRTIVSGSLSATVAGITTVSSTTYDVTVNSISGAGELRLDLKSTGTGITDAVTNSISGGYSTGQTYIIQQQPMSSGFTSITNLGAVTVSTNTGEKPQAKTWIYDGKHWAVLANGSGTYLWKLNNTTWTNVLQLSTRTTSKADCKVVGNVTHILLFQGASSQLVSVEYNTSTGTYQLWSRRTSTVGLNFDTGVEIATIDLDGTERMWLASDGSTQINVRWSDAPYTIWSAPITLASNVSTDDICAVVALPGKIGVFWSNQSTKRYGFRTHTDGTATTTWTADEVPASQSALNIGAGMADDHLNLMAASDGTLYCGVKTGYDNTSYPEIALLVRRPSGSWDNLYEVSKLGTRPIVLLNESIGKIRVVYVAADGGANIVYKESSTNSISFGSQFTLMSGVYNNPTSTHQVFSSEVVVMASSSTQAVSVLARDGAAAAFASTSGISAKEDNNWTPDKAQKKIAMQAYPNPFSFRTTVSFTLEESEAYTLSLYDSKGVHIKDIQKGKGVAAITNNVELDGTTLPHGLYIIKLQTNKITKTLKLMLAR